MIHRPANPLRGWLLPIRNTMATLDDLGNSRARWPLPSKLPLSILKVGDLHALTVVIRKGGTADARHGSDRQDI